MHKACVTFLACDCAFGCLRALMCLLILVHSRVIAGASEGQISGLVVYAALLIALPTATVLLSKGRSLGFVAGAVVCALTVASLGWERHWEHEHASRPLGDFGTACISIPIRAIWFFGYVTAMVAVASGGTAADSDASRL